MAGALAMLRQASTRLAASSRSGRAVARAAQDFSFDGSEQAVNSSAIALIGYDEDDRTLHVTFTSGRGYEFYGVPIGVYESFMGASSKGRFFNQVIKDKYSYSGGGRTRSRMKRGRR
jgi:KTSC domain